MTDQIKLQQNLVSLKTGVELSWSQQRNMELCRYGEVKAKMTRYHFKHTYALFMEGKNCKVKFSVQKYLQLGLYYDLTKKLSTKYFGVKCYKTTFWFKSV